jgi:nitrogen regulatory protein PII
MIPPADSRPIHMKYIMAIIRPSRLHAVKEALFRVGVTGMTLARVSGHGGERDTDALTPVTADEVQARARHTSEHPAHQL